MFRKNLFAPLLAASAMALALATPAHAGKADRAREAIAAADAKIHTAETMGAGSAMPHQAADARAALAMAKEKLAAGHKSTSISEAIRASALADAAIGDMQKQQERRIANEQQARSEGVAAAQQQTAVAQRQNVEANARANVAEQSAAMSAEEAAEARNAAAATRTPAGQVETTVTTASPARGNAHASASTTVTHSMTKPLTPPVGVTTTTTVVPTAR